jgi:hypothetical protein
MVGVSTRWRDVNIFVNNLLDERVCEILVEGQLEGEREVIKLEIPVMKIKILYNWK